ncbi:MAG: hypothetical protein VX265_15695 [Myxococcota bacterium]|nr:hypothetical protein [Myxococcota bacterium]
MTWFRNALNALRDDGTAPAGTPTGDGASTLSTLTTDGLELSHLGRYLVMAVLVTVCALLFAWSRIEMVEISSALGSARTQLSVADAEGARLDLELATLSDPSHLSRAAAELSLTTAVPVIDVPAAAEVVE